MRVVVIEDSWIIGQNYVAMLDNTGARVSAPATAVAQTMSLIEAAPIVAAMVDMALHCELAYVGIEALNARGVPVVVFDRRGRYLRPRA